MALSVTNVRRNIVGNSKEVIADLVFDTSYPAGGYPFTPASVDPGASPSEVFLFVHTDMNDATVADQRFLGYDYTNKKLMIRTAANTEASGDQSAVGCKILARYGSPTG